jgi:hypothetical protein
MQRENVRWNYSCGLPRKFHIQKVVLGYADLSVTQQEYEYYYATWTKEEQQFADHFVNEIEIATIKEKMN